MFIRVVLIFLEVLVITIMNYYMATSYYSLDVLYCLPVIQTASFSALLAQRRSDTQILFVVAISCALAWSLAEAAVTWPNFPLSAFLMNVFTRGVTFLVIGRVITKLWKDKQYTRKDWLTGLANRVELIEWVETNQMKSERSGKPYSLLVINVDGFRALNNKLGHHVGDEALVVLANTLLENSRSNDIAARIGSDEFVLLITDSTEAHCGILAGRITLAAEKKFSQNGWGISLSHGHITEIGNRRSVDNLLRAAGEEMYAMKQSKQSQLHNSGQREHLQ
jgi:diguanylate cyclase (GGDEF)-like protein